MHYWIVNGKQMTEAEYQDHQRQELEARERVQREAAALVKKLGQTYEALTSLMQQHPEVDREITDKTAVDEEIYEKLRHNLERADEGGASDDPVIALRHGLTPIGESDQGRGYSQQRA
jgi:hypothetical protein